MSDLCPFCTLSEARVVAVNNLAVVIRDAFPVSTGHTLIIPRRHIESFFHATSEEYLAMLALMDQAKQELDVECRPAGYNIGVNDGSAAGQTITHLHIHLIPRYTNDSSDPRGGVRWIIPDKAAYWTK